jgi:uncharacterized protein YkwD
VRLRGERLEIAILFLAVAACDDAEPTGESVDNQFGDEGEVAADEGSDLTGETDGGADAGRPPRRDAGLDAAIRVDAADPDPSRDGGARRDGGASDAASPSSDDGSVPAGEVCSPTASWDPTWVAFEDEVLRLTNEARSVGHNCDTAGNFSTASPLAMEGRLRCAARRFSEQMAKTGTFSHTGADGSTLEGRLDTVGYTRRSAWGENIAKNQQTPTEVVAGWLDSDGHCANVMNPKYTQIGVGFYSIPSTNPKGRSTRLWTQNFAAPR